MLPLHTTRKDRERKNSKYLLATCAIWVKHSPGQGNRLAGTGSLVKNFFEDEKIHLITSKEVISTDAVNSYFLRFKKLNGSDKRRRELNSIGNKVEFISPGLAIVHVDPDKVSFIRKRTSGLLTYRPFAICAEENEGNSELYFHVVKRSGNKSFDIISLPLTKFPRRQKTLTRIEKALELQLPSQPNTARQKLLVSSLVTTTCRFIVHCFHRLTGLGYVQVGNFWFVKRTCKCICKSILFSLERYRHQLTVLRTGGNFPFQLRKQEKKVL